MNFCSPFLTLHEVNNFGNISNNIFRKTIKATTHNKYDPTFKGGKKIKGTPTSTKSKVNNP